MPEPSSRIGSHLKTYPVLGQRGQHFDGETVIDAGCSINGMIYYLYECYGGEGWDSEATDEQIKGTFRVSDGFEGKALCAVTFKRKPLEEILEFAPGIDRIDEQQVESTDSAV